MATVMPSTIFETDLYWAAGLLEGEGSFHGARRGTNELRVTCQMTDQDVIERLLTIFGGHRWFPKLSGNQIKASFIWSTSTSHHAYQVMKMLQPLMGQRRKAKIDSILEAYEANGLAKFDARTQRDELICTLRSRGARIKEIATQADCSTGTVKNVIHGRKSQKGSK